MYDPTTQKPDPNLKKRLINETINMTTQIPVTLTQSDAIFVYIFV